MILKFVTKKSLSNKSYTLLVFGEDDIIDELFIKVSGTVDILIVSDKIVDVGVLNKLLSLLSIIGKFYVYESMKKELKFYYILDDYIQRCILIVPPKVVKRKSLFIGYNIDQLVIPKNIKDLDKENTLERYLFPVMNARVGSEIIYL